MLGNSSGLCALFFAFFARRGTRPGRPMTNRSHNVRTCVHDEDLHKPEGISAKRLQAVV